MALTPVDRALLQRCLEHADGAWNDFVDRFLGLIYHTIHHTAYLRSAPLQPEDVEDIAAEILLQVVARDFAVLRQFKGQSSLATYLSVVARRISIHEIAKRRPLPTIDGSGKDSDPEQVMEPEDHHRPDLGLENLEEVEHLLKKLPAKEREIVRLTYVEGRSYEEISTELRIPVNSIGPILNRARARLRKGVKKAPPILRRTRRQPESSEK